MLCVRAKSSGLCELLAHDLKVVSSSLASATNKKLAVSMRWRVFLLEVRTQEMTLCYTWVTLEKEFAGSSRNRSPSILELHFCNKTLSTHTALWSNPGPMPIPALDRWGRAILIIAPYRRSRSSLPSRFEGMSFRNISKGSFGACRKPA